MTLKMSRSAKIRNSAIVVGLTVMLLPFQNCILTSLAGKAADQSSTNGAAPGAAGMSPTSVQLSWEGVATSSSYNVYNMNQGSTPVSTTVFTTSRVNNLTPGTDYAFSVRGSRGVGQYLTDALGTYQFTTWPLFTGVNFTVAPEDDSSQTISWAYAPWDSSNLPASADARRGSTVTCAFVPVPANTDPLTINPTTPGPGVTPYTFSGPLFAQKLNLPLGTIDSSLTYAAQCTANYVDDSHSVSTQNFLVNPAHLVAPCPASALIATSYSCIPNVRIPSQNAAVTYTLALAPESNTCDWARVVATNIESNGTLTAANIGTCNLAYRYTIPALGYESPIINRNVTISVPESFHVFPSFAVRAISGAIAFPHLYSQLLAAPDQRAQIHSDIVTDFGNGSSFFAGGATPFPVFNPTAPTMTSTFFYGFPVSAVISGVRPTGYSLDAIRPNWQSSLATEGFMRGNLIVPKSTISNPAFLTATGTSVGSSLFDFLNNRYTFDGGANYAPASLGYFLNTIADRDLTGTAASNPWSGITIEQPAVTFNLPSARAIAAFIPPTGVKGANTLFANANANKKVTGLASAAANNSLFYVANCQNSATTYANPAACTPASGAALPTAISCLGDVVVNAPLLLINPTFITDVNGCRVHATGTIFVHGQITVLNGDGTANTNAIQLMSSRAVVFGFSLTSLGVDSSGARTANGGGLIDQVFAGGTTNPYLTSVNNGPGAASAALNAIAQDAFVVNLKPIDTLDPMANGDQTYNHLVVAAPYVFSAYSGVMTGSLIAEVAAFPFLKFDADPALIGQTPFPLFTGTAAPLIVTAPTN